MHFDHTLVIPCEDCGADVAPQFEAIDEGCRTLTGYCVACGFLTVETSTPLAVNGAAGEAGAIAA